MNKQLHRVIFNAARGARMAVHEGASSNSGRGRLKATAVVAFVALASPGQFALAQIAGDPSAPANQRPVIVDAANGTPLVHIQTPSAGGVSRNAYRQFDVNGQGAILNNSRTRVQTQLGGWVQGNPYLANGPARIILNEVNSANPSQLRGYVEVAGQRAEVIIANPAGIQVNGGGFINASRATLTTGTPKFNEAGSLESFLVRGSTVSVEGAGLDASKTDYAAILARAIQVNAGIWASELKVAAGANEISADPTNASVTPVAGNGPGPAFALDVAQLGGMYAGKITLVGTEAGVGVRNAGDIGAGAGGLVVTAKGRLENTGTLRAARVVDLKSAANIENHTGGTIEAQSVQLSSAADVINRGTIRQTGSTTLAVQAPSLSNTQGGYIGAQPLPQAAGGAQGGQAAPSDPAGSAGTGGGQPGGPAQSEGTGAPTASATAGTAGTAPAPMAEPPQPGQIVAAGSVRNDGGRIYAGDVKLQTPSIDNSGGQLSVNELAVSGPRFSNAGGTLNVANAFSAQVDRFDNAGGQLNAGQLAVKTGQLDNRGGTLRSNSNNSNVATLEARGDVLNAQGTLASTGALTVTAGGQLENTGGQVQATQALQVNAGSLVNTGILRGEQATGVAVRDTLLNVGGSITSGGDTRLSAATLQSTSAATLGAGITPDGSLGEQGNLDVQTTQALQAHGRQLAAGTVNLRGASVDLSGSATSGAQVGITADTGDIVTTSAKVVTPGQLSLKADSQATQALVNTGGTLNAAALELRLANVRNTQGGEIAQTASQPLNLQVAGEVDNTGGRIVGNGDVTLGAAQLRNNAGGQIGAGGALHVQARDAADNAGGTLQANQNVDVRAASLDNSGGTIGAVAGGVNLATQGQTRNVGGKVRAGAAAVLANAGLDNAGGQVVGASLAIDTRGGALVNTNGALASTGSGTGQGVDNCSTTRASRTRSIGSAWRKRTRSGTTSNRASRLKERPSSRRW